MTNVAESNVEAKRSMISFINSIFDPYGIIEPVKLEGKKVYQKTLSYDWDEKLSDEIIEQFKKVIKDIEELKAIRFKRYIKPGKVIHAFADASIDAVGFVIFQDGKFVFERSKTVTNNFSIPVLELCAIIELLKGLIKIGLTGEKIYIYSDSLTNLQRLQKTPNEIPKKEKKKVIEVLKLTEILRCRFFHVPGKKNPADIFTQEGKIKNLIKLNYWNFDEKEIEKEIKEFFPIKTSVK